MSRFCLRVGIIAGGFYILMTHTQGGFQFVIEQRYGVSQRKALELLFIG